jgi:4-amino-4-deoxy-L-arabinose transferase-like glycosyltransferase
MTIELAVFYVLFPLVASVYIFAERAPLWLRHPWPTCGRCGAFADYLNMGECRKCASL